MTLYRTVRRFIFVNAGGGDQYAGHHRQRTEGGSDHIAHHVAVIVFARPDVTAVGTHYARDGVVDQGVEVGDARSLELFLIFVLEYFRENILEGVVVLFADRILGREPYVFLLIERVIEAGSCKGCDRIVEVVNPLDDTVAVVKGVDQLTALVTVCVGDAQLSLGAFFHDHFGVLIDVAVGVTRDADGLCPGGNVGSDALDEDRLTEYGAVEDRADGAVGAFPHLFEVIFVHAGGVGGNSRALDRYAVFFCRFCRVDRDLIVGFVSLFQTEIVVLAFEIDKGKDQLIL